MTQHCTGEQQESDGGTDQCTGCVQGLVEAERLAEVFPPDRRGEHRGPDRLSQPSAHPRESAGDDDLRPRVDRDQQTEPEDGGAVAADSEPLSPCDSVAVPAAPQLDHRRRTVRDPLHQPHRKRRRAKARRDEQGQNREHHLVVGIRSQVRDPDPDDVSVQPPGLRRRFCGRAQTISNGSGRNGPPSRSATKALASTGSPFATETITYTYPAQARSVSNRDACAG